MRKGLIVLLGLGVLMGYGSALGSARYHWRMHHGGYEGGCGWSQRYQAPAPVVTAPAPAPVPAPAPAPVQQLIPQIIIVQPQMVPAAPAPTVIVQPAPAPVEVKKVEQPAKAVTAE